MPDIAPFQRLRRRGRRQRIGRMTTRKRLAGLSDITKAVTNTLA